MIKTVITDVDGVLTDGGFYYTLDGKIMKRFAPHDSDGIKLLKSAGIHVAAITADHRGFDISKLRCDDMGISCDLVSESERFSYISSKYGTAGVAFIGDGIHDVLSLCNVELGISPNNGCEAARSSASYVCNTRGGDGVLLEVAEYILSYNKRYS